MTTRRCNIDVDAKVGIGVLSQEAPGRACPPAPIQSRLGPGHRVLVAEDDGLTALAVVDTLTALGAERIELCSPADEALELIAQLRPTVLILDLGLADRSDGWTVAELAREIVSTPPAIVFATGAPERLPYDIARRGHVLRKPFTQLALADAVVRAAAPRGLLGRLWHHLAG